MMFITLSRILVTANAKAVTLHITGKKQGGESRDLVELSNLKIYKTESVARVRVLI